MSRAARIIAAIAFLAESVYLAWLGVGMIIHRSPLTLSESLPYACGEFMLSIVGVVMLVMLACEPGEN